MYLDRSWLLLADDSAGELSPRQSLLFTAVVLLLFGMLMLVPGTLAVVLPCYRLLFWRRARAKVLTRLPPPPRDNP